MNEMFLMLREHAARPRYGEGASVVNAVLLFPSRQLF